MNEKYECYKSLQIDIFYSNIYVFFLNLKSVIFF